MRKIILTSMLVLASSNVFALDLSKSRLSDNVEIAQAEPAEVPVTIAPEVPQQLVDGFHKVCNSRAVKSKKLTAACEADELPKTLKSGRAFRASGIGGEVNTLIANYEFIK